MHRYRNADLTALFCWLCLSAAPLSALADGSAAAPPGAGARAQLPADLYWADGFHPAGLQGTLYAMYSFQGSVVVGGSLVAFGNQPIGNVVKLESVDGSITSGTPLGEGLDDLVFALSEHAGQLVAGGRFSHSGDTLLDHVARWDGAAWQPFGEGLPGATVKALASYGGHLYAGAYRWDGQAWSNVLQTNGSVSFLVEHGGLLYVGGSFTMAAGVPVNNVFAWDGVNVQPLGAGRATEVIGVEVVDGAVAFATSSTVAMWDGANWNDILSGADVRSIGTMGTRLVVSYWWPIYAPYVYIPYLRSWEQGTWTTLGSVITRLMIAHDGELMLQADSDVVPGIISPGLIAHDGAAFHAAFAPGDGCDDGFWTLAPMTGSDGVIAGGEFRIADGSAIDRVGLVLAGGWHPWGAGTDLDPHGAFVDLAMIGADTYGIFSRPDVDYVETFYCRLMWQDGQAEWLRWPLVGSRGGEKLVPVGSELFVMNGGSLAKVGLTTGVMSELPGLDPDGFLFDACAHEGTVAACGRLVANAGVPCGHVLRRNGATWQDLGNPDGAIEVTTITSLGSAGLAVAYRPVWGAAKSVALHDGTQWQSLGGEFDADVTNLILHRGYLFAAGGFDRVGDVEAHGLAMWTGSAWVPVGSGLLGYRLGRVTDLASSGDNLWICGTFKQAGGRPSAGLACWSGNPAALAAASAVPALPGRANVLLRPASPNPFNPRTELSFSLPAAGQARLVIHDVRGARVRSLVDDSLAAGEHRVEWDGRDNAGRQVPSGTYVARLEAGPTVEAVKLVLVR
ncbi:MAG: hypothetical protein IPH48_11480 [bacterium]|nr:hypothetical protein [bacterium]